MEDKSNESEESTGTLAQERAKRAGERIEQLYELSKRRHRHLVVIGSLALGISCIFFGLEILGPATVVGIIGTLMICIADL